MIIIYRCLGRLPLGILYALASVIYLLLYYVAGYRKATVMDNLANAFPDQSEREITILAKKFYRQLADVAMEIIKARYMSQEEFQRRVKVLNPELINQCSGNLSTSVIILTIHQGNWEWMLHGMSACLGVPLDPVYKPLHGLAADRYMLEVRRRFGARPIPARVAPKDILRNRRDSRLLAMVADQSPITRERSHWTEFLNQQAAFYLGPEIIARSTGYPVVFAQCRRVGRGHYQVELHPLGEPPYMGSEGEITDRYVDRAEIAIREEPESWLWSNRRWKRKKAGY